MTILFNTSSDVQKWINGGWIKTRISEGNEMKGLFDKWKFYSIFNPSTDFGIYSFQYSNFYCSKLFESRMHVAQSEDVSISSSNLLSTLLFPGNSY